MQLVFLFNPVTSSCRRQLDQDTSDPQYRIYQAFRGWAISIGPRGGGGGTASLGMGAQNSQRTANGKYCCSRGCPPNKVYFRLS